MTTKSKPRSTWTTSGSRGEPHATRSVHFHWASFGSEQVIVTGDLLGELTRGEPDRTVSPCQVTPASLHPATAAG